MWHLPKLFDLQEWIYWQLLAKHIKWEVSYVVLVLMWFTWSAARYVKSNRYVLHLRTILFLHSEYIRVILQQVKIGVVWSNIFLLNVLIVTKSKTLKFNSLNKCKRVIMILKVNCGVQESVGKPKFYSISRNE